MRIRSLLLGVSLILALLVPVLALPATALPAVNVFDSGEYQAEVSAGQSATYQWVVYNNGSAPLLVEISVNNSSGTGWDAVVKQDLGALNPGTSRAIALQFNTSRDCPTLQVEVTVLISLMNMSNPSDKVVIEKAASTHVLSLFGTTAGENKIFNYWENGLPAPLNTNVGAFLITLLLWIAIGLVIYFVVNPIVHQFTKKTKTDLDDIILQVIKAPVFLLIVLFGFLDSLIILNIDSGTLRLIMEIYQSGLILIIAWLVYRVYDKVVIYYANQWAKKSETELDDVLVPLMHKAGMVIIPLAAVVALLGAIGVDVTLFVAGMGVIGLIIAFAAQETMSNFFAGVQLLADRPFKVGDLITLDSGEIVEVKKIGLRSTTLYNGGNNEIIVLPNNDIANKKVINQTRPDGRRKITIEVGVAYGTEVAKVKEILYDIAIHHPHVLKDEGKEPIIRLAEFADSSINFKMFAWVDDINNQWSTASDIREEVDKRFREAGIEIPFPQQVVYYKNLPGEQKD